MDDIDYFLRKQTHVYVCNDGENCGYVCYYTKNEDVSEEIYNSYSAAKYFNLPYTKEDLLEPEGLKISYHYEFRDNFYQLGFITKNIEKTIYFIHHIKKVIKEKGFKVCEKEPDIRYWWSQFTEYRAYRIISEWLEQIRYNPEYKYCRKRLNREHDKLFN
jgi:hypothetical protein